MKAGNNPIKEIQNVGIKPWLNASKHGYAQDAIDRMMKGQATRKDIENELSERADEKEVRQILNEIIGKNKT